jgi:adenylate cyclase
VCRRCRQTPAGADLLDPLPLNQTDDDPAAAEALARTLLAYVRAEFEAPVAAVSGLVDILIEDAGAEAFRHHLPDLERMKAAASRLATLIATWLDENQTEVSLAESEFEVFASHLRHDLRTPITTILGYAELVAEEARDEGCEPLLGTLADVQDAAQRLLEQIDSMVAFVAGQRGTDAETGPTEPSLMVRAIETIRQVLDEQAAPETRVTGRILVVDDNESILDLLSRQLTREGHEVEICDSGEKALARLDIEPFDLLLLDLMMPGINGLDVLRQLKADPHTATLPVVMISALDETETAVRCIEAGAEDYLAKPPNPILLRARIAAALERKFLRDRDEAATQTLRAEQERSERLLRNVLPGPIVDRLRDGETVIADHFDAVTILFCDLVGFTALTSRLSPGRVLDLLSGIFSGFDRLAAEFALEKIKTIGDAYMVAGGLPRPHEGHVRAVAAMALRMPEVVAKASRAIGEQLTVRIGIDTGPAVAGIIGTQKFLYDVWGDTVNTASRMEHHCEPGRVHITQAVKDALGETYTYEALPPVEVKGKGRMETFYLA